MARSNILNYCSVLNRYGLPHVGFDFIITRLINFNDAISIMTLNHARNKHLRTIQIYLCRIYVVYINFMVRLPDDKT